MERGAKHLLSVEFNRKVYETCRLNIESMNQQLDTQIFVNAINTEAIKLLKSGYKKYSTKTYQKLGKETNRFDFVYIDPPYNHGDYFQALKNLLDGDWVSNNCMAICEFSISNGINLPEGWQVKDQKKYGDTGLIFLTPSQA
jgi:16S rRNA G966 N2-methylase RsmD